MPVMTITKKGKTCHKYGKKGRVYCGKGSRAKAARQGRAIKVSQHRRGK